MFSGRLTALTSQHVQRIDPAMQRHGGQQFGGKPLLARQNIA